MINEWKPSDKYRNFGDAIGEIVIEALSDSMESSEVDFASNQSVMYFPIGSVVSDYFMRPLLESGITPVFIGCGWTGDELSTELVKASAFVGCRGPYTQAALKRSGMPGVAITGDTAYIAYDFLDLAPEKHGKSLLIPHISLKTFNKPKAPLFGTDEVLLPRVQTRDDVVGMIKYIAGADFVLASAMHGAITAHAYNVPFAIFSQKSKVGSGVPPKWVDWLASIGVSDKKDVYFSTNLKEGQEWYDYISQKYNLTSPL